MRDSASRTYNDDGTVNVMNLHECMRTNAGDLALCIGPRSKTHENIKKRRAFTVALVNQNLIEEVDYFGIVSGHRVPEKFAKTGMFPLNADISSLLTPSVYGM